MLRKDFWGKGGPYNVPAILVNLDMDNVAC